EHGAALFVVPASGGPSKRLAETVRIFNLPSPRPLLRWSPDGKRLSVLGTAAGRPEVFGIDPVTGESTQLTKAPEGVLAYEWSPDAASLAFVTLDPMPQEEEQRRADKSFVIVASAPDRPARLALQRLDNPSAIRMLTPPSQYVDALSWSPGGRAI